MKKIVEYAHKLVIPYLKQDGIAVDFTLGLGNDALFLAQQPQLRKIYAFDIQEQAIQHSKQRLQDESIHHVDCILDGHEHCDNYIKETICAGMFNFGYLPHGDPAITTMIETSAVAVRKALNLLEKNGILVMVIYPGHSQGKLEQQFFDKWSEQLHTREYVVMRVTMHNKKASPYIIAIEKLV